MSKQKSLKADVNTHFEFGDNWAAYSESIDGEKIRQAENGLQRLLSPDEIADRTFLDIGSGSGMHSLAALNLGAASVTAIDFDPASIATSKKVLARFSQSENYRCLVGSVFELPLGDDEKFDIVYSWGVLHHTGDMWPAIDKAIERVQPGGKLIIAIYLKTWFCGFWKAEKRLFTSLPRLLRWPIIWVFSALCFLRILFSGTNPIRYIAEYNRDRGMNWFHDRIDWLGGYPYESASAEEITSYVSRRGGVLKRSLGTKPSIGLLGSGCAEYVFEFTDSSYRPPTASSNT